jgi:predicted PurR-regulated permease PerM
MLDRKPATMQEWLIILTTAGLIGIILIKFDPIFSFLSKLFTLLTPLFYAIVFAFLLNQIMRRLEKLFDRFVKHESKFTSFKRPLALLLTIVILLAIFATLILLIVPQLISSSVTLFNNAPTYIQSIEGFTNQLLDDFAIPYQISFFQDVDWTKLMPQITEFLKNYWPAVYSQAMSVTGILFNFFMGLVLSIFFLAQKEMYLRQLKKLLLAVTSEQVGQKTLTILIKANQIFGNFISGQLTEGMILIIMYYIGLSLLNMPYTILISVLIGIMSFIPMFGTIAAMLFGTLIILAIDPLKALWFVVFFQIVQQIEGNLIYPRVVGNKVGLSGTWVLLAIVIFGGLYGLFGILMAVPTTALLHSLLSEWVNYRLSTKQLVPIDQQNESVAQ